MDPLATRTIGGPTRSDQAARLLTELITSGQLASGAFLPTEAELCHQLGVSRATIREAVRKLEARGLVVSRHGVGVQVADGTEQAVSDSISLLLQRRRVGPRDMLEVRLTLECQAAALAAERGSAAAIAMIAAAIDAMRDPSLTISEQVRNDLDFHLRIAEASQNVVLVALVHAIRGLLLDTITATFETNPSITERIEFHASILEGIQAHDPVAAQAAMRTHLLMTEQLIHRLTTIPHATREEGKTLATGAFDQQG